jgi:hypothetical protein
MCGDDISRWRARGSERLFRSGAASGPVEVVMPNGDVDHRERSSLARWLEREWPRVHVCFAEVLRAGEDAIQRRPRLRAVVQLGGLTPADVRVTARLAAAGSEAASREPLRLWSVQSHHNGAFVFEAATAAEPPFPTDGAPELLVTVAPAPAERGDVVLSDVVRVVASGERADCASPASYAGALRDACGESRLGAGSAG